MKTKTDNSKLKEDVLDSINKILIQLKHIKSPKKFDYIDEYNKIVDENWVDELEDHLKYLEEYNMEGVEYGSEAYHEGYADNAEEIEEAKKMLKKLKAVDMDTQFLACVKAYLKRVVKGSISAAAHNETQYYTSNC